VPASNDRRRVAARALFGWELGANLGHAGLIAEIARALIADGVEVTVVATELGSARIALTGVPARLLQAPRWPYHRHQGNEIGQSGYQDILALVGFSDPAKLSAVVDAWSNLIDLIHPDVIIADHGPGLMVAAYGRGIPVAAIGTGFTMPPLDSGRLPPLRADRAPLIPEARLLAAAAQALATRGIAAPDALATLFRSDERFVFGVPELDPYRAYRNEPLYAPPGGMPAFVEPPVRPHLFVYLGDDMPYLDVLAKVLGEADHFVTAYFRGDVGLIPDFLERRGHTIHRTPPRLDEVLPTVSHVLSAGGLYTAVAALAAGRPQLVMPLHDETRLNYRMLEQLGVAHQLAPSGDPQAVAGALASFLFDHTLAPETRHWAKVIAARPHAGIADVISAIRRRMQPQ
jgi:rhamnosyltransferase subunit B